VNRKPLAEIVYDDAWGATADWPAELAPGPDQ
jgi:hypothetical protein